MDTYRGEKNDPGSLHLYAYCANDPINFVDPTGHAKTDSFNKTFRRTVSMGRKLPRLYVDASATIFRHYSKKKKNRFSVYATIRIKSYARKIKQVGIEIKNVAKGYKDGYFDTDVSRGPKVTYHRRLMAKTRGSFRNEQRFRYTKTGNFKTLKRDTSSLYVYVCVAYKKRIAARNKAIKILYVQSKGRKK